MSTNLPESAPADEPSAPESIAPHGPRRSAGARVGGLALAAALTVGGVLGVKALSGNGSPAAATSASAAGAARPQGGFPGGGTFGTLTSVNGSTLTLTMQDGTTKTVTTSSTTRITKTVDGTLSDIKVGDNVVAMGTANGTTITAQRVTDRGTQAPGGPGANGARPNGNGGPPPGAAPNGGAAGGGFAAGTVKSISGSTIVLTAPDGTATTVKTESATTYSVTKTVALSALITGQNLVVQGTPNSDGSIAATNVQQGGGFGGRPGGPGGGSGAPSGTSASGTN
jgi:hypothetical protein